MGSRSRGHCVSQQSNLRMTPSIKFALPCFLLIFIVGRSKAFDFEPKGGWGPLWLNQTEPDGEIDQLGDLTVRRYGPASNSKWVLWGHDIFGPLSGRTMEYCAKMNQDLGVTCILPDFFRGADPWVPGDPLPSTWAQMGMDWEEKLVPYLNEGGATSVAVVGTCFGSYTGVHTSASPHGHDFMKGGIYFHPSHTELMGLLSEDETEAYMQISSPQAFGDTPDSSVNVRPGGLASMIIETTFFEEFESPCDHGFFNRGDLEDPVVAECVQRGMELTINFITQYVVRN